MSAPDDEGNPWLSLADLLQKKIPVAKLATAIENHENHGIQTYDRFGRRIAATDEGAEVQVSKANALDLLARYYAYDQDWDQDPDVNPDWWFEHDSPLFNFGWPKDEAPDFDKIEVEEVPKPRKPIKRDIDAPQPRGQGGLTSPLSPHCARAAVSIIRLKGHRNVSGRPPRSSVIR